MHFTRISLIAGVRARTEWRVGGAAGGGSIDGHLSSGLLSPPDQLTSRACLSVKITAKNCDPPQGPWSWKKAQASSHYLLPPPAQLTTLFTLLSDLTNLNGREIEI